MPDIQLKYFGYHPYNNPTHSERNVEIPLGFWFLDHFKNSPQDLIEIGEVTSFYQPAKHVIYDIAGEQSATIRQDAADIDYTGKNLLSISTIEHIGTADYGQTPDQYHLPLVLEKMLKSKNYLITFALGYNRHLEEMVKELPFFLFKRVKPTRWEQVAERNLADYQYHSPWYAGNGLCVLTNLQDFRFSFVRRSLFRILPRCRAPKWSWKNLYHAWRQERADQHAEPAAA